MIARAAACAVLAALVAGCGDSGPSKGDFTKRADAICAAGNRAIAPLNQAMSDAQRGSNQGKVFTTLAQVTKRSVAVSTSYIDKLDGLATPSSDRDKLKAWIADVRRQLTLIRQLGNAFGTRDQAAIVRLSEQVDALNTKNNRFAASYGMRECAKR